MYCTVDYIAKAYKVQTENASSICALADLQHLMFSLLPEDCKKLFRTGAGKGYKSFREHIVATFINALQNDAQNPSRQDKELVQR